MHVHPIQQLIDELEAKKEGLSEPLLDGAARDYAGYLNMCGEIRGLSFAQEHLKDLLRRMENDDE